MPMICSLIQINSKENNIIFLSFLENFFDLSLLLRPFVHRALKGPAIYANGALCFLLYCIVLYCIGLDWIGLYCIVLYCIVLYCIVLYCIRLD